MSARNEAQGIRRRNHITAVCFQLAALVLFCFIAVPPALGQAEYSDSYAPDNSGYEYDPESDSLIVPDGAPDPILVGVGVGEDSYDSPTYMTSTSTTITSPDGRTAYAYSEGGYYARAEGEMSVNVETGAEGDYAIDSEHTYYREEQSCYDTRLECNAVKASPSPPGALFVRAAYSLSPLRSRTPAWPYYYYIRRFTRFFPVRFTRVFSGYELVQTGLNPCPPRAPYAYLLYCPDVHNCRFPPRVCRPIPTAFSQGVGFKITFFGAGVCRVRFFHQNFVPRCS